jgi:hypothetical protein
MPILRFSAKLIGHGLATEEADWPRIGFQIEVVSVLELSELFQIRQLMPNVTSIKFKSCVLK